MSLLARQSADDRLVKLEAELRAVILREDRDRPDATHDITTQQDRDGTRRTVATPSSKMLARSRYVDEIPVHLRQIQILPMADERRAMSAARYPPVPSCEIR